MAEQRFVLARVDVLAAPDDHLLDAARNTAEATGDRTFSAGLLVNFGLVFFFASFMFVLTLLLQAGLGQPPLHAGIEALPLAAAFTVMSILSPRFSARLGSRSITLGATITTLGTIGLAVTDARYGADLTGWDLAPATVLIGLGQGIALPSLIGAVLAHVRTERAGAAPGSSPPPSSSAPPAVSRSSARSSMASSAPPRPGTRSSPGWSWPCR